MEEARRIVKFRSERVKRKLGRVWITLAEFYSLPTAKDPDLVSACSRDELVMLIRDLQDGSWLEVDDQLNIQSDDLYERLMVYAAVRQSFRDPSRMSDLRAVVKELGAFEVHFWASVFADAYRQSGSRAALFRPAKAFKILYRLARC